MEDLWAFNEEAVARAICNSEIPVISAVGHEPDVTIADFAADLRAATPSNAAELAVPDQAEVSAALSGLGGRLEQAMRQRLLRSRQTLDRLGGSRMMTDPRAYFQDKRILLDYQGRRLGHGLDRCLGGQRERRARLSAARKDTALTSLRAGTRVVMPSRSKRRTPQTAQQPRATARRPFQLPRNTRRDLASSMEAP